MSAGGIFGAPLGRATTRIRRRLSALRRESGFTLIEVLLAGVILAIIAAPISAILSSGAVVAKLARERTGADQLMQQQIEVLRATPYTSVGVVAGNPKGVFAASTDTTLPTTGEAVTVKWAITWVADAVPENAYISNADYKKAVLTIVRKSDQRVLDTTTTYVAAGSAPPAAGTTWVQVKRNVQDAVTLAPIVGANVNITGGPDTSPPENRNDTTDSTGSVLFPALTGKTSSPAFTLVTTYTGYSVFPDDISPGTPSSIPSTPGLNSIGTIRMYQGTSLTINLQTSGGAAYTSGATVSVDSSRCGLASVTVPSGQSSVTVTTCNPWGTTSVPLPPNLAGQTPADSTYYVTAWNTTSGNWSTGTAVAVPANYPTNLTQTVNVKMVSATFPSSSSQQKTIKVTVTKGGSNDTNARVEVTGAPTGISPGIADFATTNGSGQATFTVPVVSSSTTFTINANDMGVTKGSNTVSLSTGSSSSTNVTVTIS